LANWPTRRAASGSWTRPSTAAINFFDTAGVYGGPQWPDMEKGYGVSEEIIGRWLAQGGFHGNCWAGAAALQHTDDRKLMGKCSTHNKDGAEDIQRGPRWEHLKNDNKTRPWVFRDWPSQRTHTRQENPLNWLS
jgi:hypothetical protein